MSIVPTLHSICFDFIKTHSEDLISLEGIPYKPIVQNLIEYLFTSDIPINESILSVITHSHSKALRSANLPWTRLNYEMHTFSIYPRLQALSQYFPKFITHLKIGLTDLCDNDIHLLSGFTNLKVLDFAYNQNITDRTVSYITTMALNISNGKGLPYLEELYFDHVKGITDKSLKFFGKLIYLCHVSLSGTGVTTDVAKTYLASHGYQLIHSCLTSPWSIYPSQITDQKMYLFIEKKSLQYHTPVGRIKYKATDLTVDPKTPSLIFRRKLTRASFNKKIPKIEEKKPIKKQRLNTNDFLAMFETEIANDFKN